MPISAFFGKWNSILFKGPCFVSKERQKEHHGNSTLKAFLSQWLLGQFLLNLVKWSPWKIWFKLVQMKSQDLVIMEYSNNVVHVYMYEYIRFFQNYWCNFNETCYIASLSDEYAIWTILKREVRNPCAGRFIVLHKFLLVPFRKYKL